MITNNILQRIFRKILSYFKVRLHVGLIFSFDEKTINNIWHAENPKNNNSITIRRIFDSSSISEFYIRNGENRKPDSIQKWLKNGFPCWAAFENDVIVGVSWTWKGKVELNGLSGRAFSKNKLVSFDENSFYICHVLVDSKIRGKGIMALLEKEQIRYHIVEEGFNQGVITMGVDNIPSVKTQTKIGGKLVVISFMLLILNFQFRKIIFSDSKEINWE